MTMTDTRVEDLRHQADALLAEGRARHAFALYDDARLDQPVDGSTAYYVARLAMLSGELASALQWIEVARAAYTDEGDDLSALRTDLGRGNILDDLGRHGEAAEVASLLSTELDRIVQSGELRADGVELADWMQGAALENLGAALGYAGQHERAVTALRRALDHYRSTGDDQDRGRVLANLGIESIEVGDASEALEPLENALILLRSEGDPSFEHRCLIHLGHAFALGGFYGRALASLSQADSLVAPPAPGDADADDLRLMLTRNEVLCLLNSWHEVQATCDAVEGPLHERQMRRDLALAKDQRSRALLAQGQTVAAAGQAHAAIDLLEDLGLPIRAAKSRLTLARSLGGADGSAQIEIALAGLKSAGERRSLVEGALVGVEVSPDPATAAGYFRIASQSGANEWAETRWQVEALAASEALDRGDTADATRLLGASLDTLGSIRSSVHDSTHRMTFGIGRRGPLERLVAVLADSGDIRSAFELSARHRSLSFANNSLPEPGDPQHGSTVLYQVTGDRILAFVEDGSGLRMVDLGSCRSEVEKLTVGLEAQWRHLIDPRLRPHLPTLRAATEDILWRLWSFLLAPVEAEVGSMLIVPTGNLTSIPFHALHDGTSYVVDRFATASALTPSTGASPCGTRKTLAVGVADHLAPSISAEATLVAELTGGQLLLGTSATIGNVRASCEVADTIHLACHGRFDRANPWMSAIRLADGWLSAAELATWDFSGKTVVLAGCESGSHANVAEDEVLGMGRALLTAGAAEVIVNLWPVDDDAATAFGSSLHRSLAHMPAIDALRNAHLSTKQIHDHPYLWAAPVLFRGPARQTTQ